MDQVLRVAFPASHSNVYSFAKEILKLYSLAIKNIPEL